MGKDNKPTPYNRIGSVQVQTPDTSQAKKFAKRLKRAASVKSYGSQHQNRRSSKGGQLAVPDSIRHKSKNQIYSDTPRSASLASGSSGGSSGGLSDGSGDNVRRRRKRRGNKKNEKDNIFTRVRDIIAESDVFVAKTTTPPHETCIYIGIYAVPVFLILLVWDTLAVMVFEVPHLSMLEYPTFILAFQFVTIFLAMYGYCIHIVTYGGDKLSSLGFLSLATHYVLFGWRVFMEIYFDGYRYQEKSYLPRPT